MPGEIYHKCYVAWHLNRSSYAAVVCFAEHEFRSVRTWSWRLQGNDVKVRNSLILQEYRICGINHARSALVLGGHMTVLNGKISTLKICLNWLQWKECVSPRCVPCCTASRNRFWKQLGFMVRVVSPVHLFHLNGCITWKVVLILLHMFPSLSVGRGVLQTTFIAHISFDLRNRIFWSA